MSNDFSSNRQDMVSGRELGGFLEQLMDSDRVASNNETLELRSFVVVRWLKQHDAPDEVIRQAMEDSSAGNNAILTVVDEIRYSFPTLLVVPKEALELLLEAAGLPATRLFIQLCEEEFEEYERNLKPGGKDYREKQGRP